MILVFCGSLREDSFNRKLARLVVKRLKSERLKVKLIDLKNYDLPVYNQDFDETSKVPSSVKRLAKEIKAAKGIVVVSPEYNGSIPGGLKNLVDWVSRQEGFPWKDKVYALAGVSIGPLGAVGGLMAWAQVFLKLKGFVYGNYCTISKGAEAFDSKGQLVQSYDQKQFESTLSGFLKLIKKT